MNEKQLRNAIRHGAKKTMPFSGIAHKGEPSAVRFTVHEAIVVYGKGKTRTVAVRSSIGYKNSEYKLCDVPANDEGYAIAAEYIERWEDG